MKKLTSLLLALVLVVACFSFGAVAETDPDSYLWVKDSGVLAFKITPSNGWQDQNYKLTAQVKFSEDCTGSSVYVNYYIYDDPENYDDFDHLYSFADFAKHEDATLGEWQDFTIEINPCLGGYGNYDGATIDPEDIGLFTVGIGFWNASGTIQVSNIRISESDGGNVVWSTPNWATFNPDTCEDVFSNALGTKDTDWGIVAPTTGTTNNIASDAIIDCPAGFGTYTADLFDGIASEAKTYTSDWYGFYINGTAAANTAELKEIKGTNYNVGTIEFTYAEAVEVIGARAHFWAANASGISAPALVLLSYSDDGATWTEAGELSIGTPGEVYWSELELEDAVEATYYKIEFCWNVSTGVFLFLNEVELLAPESEDESSAEDSSEEESSEEDPSEESSEESSPSTGDAGFAALGLVAVIALAGAVVASKRK